VDAILLRIRANFEAGRAGVQARLSKSLSLDRWMFVYLAPNHDDEFRALMASGEQTREMATQIRAMPVQDFIEMLQPDAFAIYRSGRLDAAQRDVQTLANFYLPAIQLSRYRRDVANLGRDVCWLTYAAEDFNRTIFTAEDLLSINPPPGVKADTLFIMGHAQRRNGGSPIAANTFGLLYRGAGLRDTDTRWRPFALMWQIDQTMETSKGYIYDLVYYERALELLGEYELYRFENPNIPDSLHSQFIVLFERVYGVLVERHLNAADTYSRLGESDARDYYLARATETEEALAKRKKALEPQAKAGG
jgi:tetratricopeptide (TPR) repeat protein